MDLKGKFITLEGSEGSGKSTQSALIADYLKKAGHDLLQLREPGGVKISEAIRNLLLDAKNVDMSNECETLLYMAARGQIVHEVILPALKSGKIIICDRFLDSTIAYQGYGNGVDISFIKLLGKFVTGGVTPDLTLLFDIETEQGLSRTNAQKDRIELRPLEYHNKVRQGYLALAADDPRRIKVIKVDAPKEEIFERVRAHLEKVLAS
jgi:dTMP kinase